MNAGELKDQITLQRLNDTTKAWDELEDGTIWAVAEAQGDAHFRFRIRFREDLRTKADIEPAMRVIYLGDAYDLVDVVEVERRHETHLIASRRIVEPIEDLQTGTRGIMAWP